MNKGASHATAVIYLFCARSGCRHLAIRQSATTGTGVKYCQPVRCPQCQNQNLLESNAPVAVSMRHQVYTMVEEGKSEVEIIGWMTERYGDFVRYNPPLTGQTLVLWALPVVLLLLMALILWRVRAKR